MFFLTTFLTKYQRIYLSGNRFSKHSVITPKPINMFNKTTFFRLFSFTVFIALFAGCTKDKCSTSYTYQVYEPVYLDYVELRSSVASELPRSLDNPGKIYVFGAYLFVNELNEGVHIIDNSNPASPENKAFIKIPGNVDIAVRGNVLYADSYIDLVALDISSPENAVELKRIENIFPHRQWESGFFTDDVSQGIIVSWNITDKTEKVEILCGQEVMPYYFESSFAGGDVGAPVLFSNSGAESIRGATIGSGQGGSMARFAITSRYLYAIDQSDMHLVDIIEPANPVIWNKINIGFDIETIFPYKDKLFIGSMSGMYIYDNSNPGSPSLISTYTHITSCDPVVVDDHYAYVTLRSGTPCEGFTNQLEVVDISNLSQPSLVKTYLMNNPHGLGIDNGTLFICDGSAGLKVYDATDVMTIDQHLLNHFGGIQAYDVIPLSHVKVLIMVGTNGLYQYDYSNVLDIQLLSRIPVI